MFRSIELLGFSVAILFFAALGTSTAAHAQEGVATPFDPAKSFCERQTFELETIGEVDPWLDYFSGLRSGRSATPAESCPSSTIRAILNIFGSGSVELAEDSRTAFFSMYVSRAMEPELTGRRLDTDGSFRYRNDIVLAGFVWLLCPGHGDERASCVKRNIEAFPAQFIQTSPVFCDFAELREDTVEWPPNREARALVCTLTRNTQAASSEAWLRQASITLGD